MEIGVQTASHYCHTCKERVNPVTEEVLCPNCRFGFVEEMRNDGDDEGTSVNHNTSPLHSNVDLVNFMSHLFSFPPRLLQQPSNSSSTSNSRNHVQSDAVPFPEFLQNMDDLERNNTDVSRGNPYLRSSRFVEGVVQNALGSDNALRIPFLPQWNFMEIHGNADDYAWGPSGLDDIISQLLGQLDGAGPPPASDRAIKELPSIKVEADHVESGKDCSVCMELFALGEEAKSLPCHHFFHAACIEPWLKLHNTCPICRKLVDDSCAPNSSSSSNHFPFSSLSSSSGGGASTSFGGNMNISFQPRRPDDDHSYGL